jgi:hypothetical protein
VLEPREQATLQHLLDRILALNAAHIVGGHDV